VGSEDALLELLPRRVMPWLEQLVEPPLVAPTTGSRRGNNVWGGYECRGVYTTFCQPPDAPHAAPADYAVPHGTGAAVGAWRHPTVASELQRSYRARQKIWCALSG
jgi:hypothetical protein